MRFQSRSFTYTSRSAIFPSSTLRSTVSVYAPTSTGPNLPGMDALILHHYALSPYAEKLRAMLGRADLAWRSCVTTAAPPRPSVETLVGGYRRIPVAQRGADVFCDSRVVAEEIALVSGRPELDPGAMDDTERAWVAHAEGKVFFASILAAGGPALRRKASVHLTLGDGLRLAVDRIRLGLVATTPAPRLGEVGAIVRSQLERVEARLGRDYLFGDAPRYADYATYHSLWFYGDLGEKPAMTRYPRTVAWMGRLRGFGHGGRSEIAADEALAIARDARPRPLPSSTHDEPRLGRRVSIAPSDYAHVPTSGVLVAATGNRLVLRREDPRVGEVHVHFPRDGYTVRAL